MSPRIRIFLLTLSTVAADRVPRQASAALERLRRRSRPLRAGGPGPDAPWPTPLAGGLARGHGRRSRSPAPTSTPGSGRSTAARRRSSTTRPGPSRSPATARIRFTHRARDVGQRHLDDVGRRDRPDRHRHPDQHERPDQHRLGPRPLHLHRHRHRRALAGRTPSGATTAAPAPQAASRRSPAPARTRSTPRSSTPPATATSVRTRSRSTTPLPTDTTHRSDRLAAQRRRHHGRRAPTPTPASPTSSGTSTATVELRPQRHDRPASARRAQHVFKTRIVDDVGNDSGWTTADRAGRHRRPDRHHGRPDRLGPDRRRSTSTSPAPTRTAPASRASSGSSTTAAAATSPAPARSRSPSPATACTRSRAHHRRLGDVCGWNTYVVRIDTVTPDRHDERSPPAGCRRPSLNVTVQRHRRALRRRPRRVQARRRQRRHRRPPPRRSSTVTGEGEHTLETRVVDEAGNSQRLDRAHDPPRRDRPDQRHAGDRLDRLAHHLLLRRARRLRLAAPASTPSSWKVATAGRSAEHSAPADRDGDGHRQRHPHAADPRQRRRAATPPAGAPRRSRSTTSLPTDTTTYPSAPVSNRHVITFTGTDDRLRRRRRRVAARRRRGQDQPVGDDHRRAATHTLKIRVQDNAGNWSNWGTHTITVGRCRRTTPTPIDNTTIPTNWRTAAYTVDRVRADDNGGIGVDYIEWRVDGDEIENGPAGAHLHGHRGRRAHDRDARLGPRRQPHRLEDADAEDRQDAPAWTPARSPTGWTNTRTVTLSATDATSGVDRIEYEVDGPSPATGTINAASGSDHAVRRRRLHDQLPRLRRRRPAHELAPSTTRSTPSIPVEHERRGADRVADAGALARPDRHRRGVGHRPRRVARRRRHDPVRLDRGRHLRGHADARDARRRQGRQRLGLAPGDDQDRPHQAGQHDAAADARPGATPTTRRRSPAPTRAGSGVQRIEYKLDGGDRRDHAAT